MNRLALGRGLDALIPTKPETATAAGRQVVDLPLEKISPNPNQPRQQFDDTKLQELAASIREKGVLQRGTDGTDAVDLAPPWLPVWRQFRPL